MELLILFGLFISILNLAIVGYLVLSFILAILYSNDNNES